MTDVNDDPNQQKHAPAPASASTELLRDLRASAVFGAGPLEQRETHASWVFLAGRDAYKIKKPVKLEFLDYSTPALRRAACLEEVRINRELAGATYLGVRAIVRTPAGLVLGEEDDPRALEYVVQMRRFEESRTLQGLIEAGKLRDRDIRETARRLARFHERAPVTRDAEPAQVLERWQRNLHELEAIVDPARWRLHLVREFAHAFVAAHVAKLNERLREGRVRDGHGDLRCEHVLLADGVQIVDRIEFDPRLRQLDVGADLAFLAMDLEANGEPGAARLLLEQYRRAGGSPGEDALLAFHAAYWALVRAKVAMIAAGSSGDQARLGEAERLRALAERLRWRARGPLALIVCGPAASGKSTLAGELAERSGLTVIASDQVRKRLAGIRPEERAGAEHYSARFTLATYAALGEAARAHLAQGEGVILDATCRTVEQRSALLGAIEGVAERVLLVQCQVSLATAMRRARERMGEPGRISDATPEIVEAQYGEFQPPSELTAERLLALDCEAPLERQANEVTLALDRRSSPSAGAGPAT
ncbi:MAG TPA: AAA family ATPase [Solirubrobacteraceae bacterium]|nr:AAA family ATPase [Solirubrobacteraceae bacterium]